MFANKDDYHSSGVDDDDDVPQGREIRKPQSAIDHTGWLWKKARKPAASAPSPFKDRWFVLSRSSLLYFKSPTAQTAIAEIQLSEATIRVVDKYTDATAPPAFVSATAASLRLAASSGAHVPDTAFSWMFEIDTKQRTYLLRANNAAEYKEWLSRLLAACRPSIEENVEAVRLDAALARMERDWAVREEDRIAHLSVLRNTLRDLIACEFFIGWEVDRGREEVVLCWLDCEGWRGETGEEGRREKGREIWDAYCKKGAHKEVRIDEQLRTDIRSAIDTAADGESWIGRLQLAMHALLMSVSFPAFLLSSAFYHACMATVNTNSPPASPAHHHQFALQKVKTLRMERGGGRSLGGGPPTMRSRQQQQERMDEEDMVIVLSDDDDKGGAGGGGGRAADASRRDEDMVRSYAGEGEVQTIGVEEDNDYVNVGRDGASEAAEATVRSPVHQPSAQSQQSPHAAAAYQQQQQQQRQQQQQQQRPAAPQPLTSPPQSPHQMTKQPQSPASFAAHPQQSPSQQPPQQQKGGFFKSIFSKSSAPAPTGPGAASRAAAAPSSEAQKSVEDALASFYSSKPIAGDAIANKGRQPLPQQQPNQQQRPPQQQQQQQQQLYQQQQQQRQQQPQSYPPQQQRPPASYQQQQQPPPSQQQQQQPPYRQPAQQQPPHAAASAAPMTDFLSGMTINQPPAAQAASGGAAMDMFDQLTIQGDTPPAPAAAATATAANTSAPPKPAYSSPNILSQHALDDDIFGVPSTASPTSTSPSTSAASSRPSSSASRPAAQPPPPAANPLDDDIFGLPSAPAAPGYADRAAVGNGQSAARPAASSQSRPNSPPVAAFDALEDDIFGAPSPTQHSYPASPTFPASPASPAYSDSNRPPPSFSRAPSTSSASALDDDIFGPPAAVSPPSQTRPPVPSARASPVTAAPAPAKPANAFSGLDDDIFGPPTPASRGGSQSSSPNHSSLSLAQQRQQQQQQQPRQPPPPQQQQQSGGLDAFFSVQPASPAGRGGPAVQQQSMRGGPAGPMYGQQQPGAGMGRGGGASNGMGLPPSAAKRPNEDPFASVWNAQK